MQDAPSPQPDQTADAIPPAPRQALLAERQVRQLAGIATAGTFLAQKTAKQAEDASYVGFDGGMMFARISRAVRQTIAMERSLGAHDEVRTERQTAKLYAITEAGSALIACLMRQNLAHDWLAGPDSLMMLRLTTATQRTMALLLRLDAEYALTPAQREAAWKRRVVRRRPPARPAPQAPAAPQPAAPAAPAGQWTPPREEDASPAVLNALVIEAVTDFEGDPEGTERAEALPGIDAPLAEESLTPLSVEDEIAGRSLAEIAAAACKVIGVAPAPELFEAAEDEPADGEAAAGEAAKAEATATPTDATPDQAASEVPLASPASPGLSAPTGRRGDDGAAPPGSGAGADAPPITPRESRHDPPSG